VEAGKDVASALTCKRCTSSHQEVESSKDDIAVVHNVGGDLSVAHGGDGSGGADGDGEANKAFGAAMTSEKYTCKIVICNFKKLL